MLVYCNHTGTLVRLRCKKLMSDGVRLLAELRTCVTYAAYSIFDADAIEYWVVATMGLPFAVPTLPLASGPFLSPISQ